MEIHIERMTMRLSTKLRRRIEKAAKRKEMAPSTFIRWCVEQVCDSVEWDKQIANDVKSGKIKGLYSREGS